MYTYVLLGVQRRHKTDDGLRPRRSQAAPAHEVGRQDDVLEGRPRGADQLDDQTPGLLRHHRQVIGHRRQLDEGPARGGQVVEADDGQELRYSSPTLGGRVHRTQSDNVVGADKDGGRLVSVEELEAGAEARVEVEGAVSHVLASQAKIVLVEQLSQHRLAALAGTRRPWAEDGTHAPVTELDSTDGAVRLKYTKGRSRSRSLPGSAESTAVVVRITPARPLATICSAMGALSDASVSRTSSYPFRLSSACRCGMTWP